MVMKRELSSVYNLSSAVLPNNYLMPTGEVERSRIVTIYDANFQMVREKQRYQVMASKIPSRRTCIYIIAIYNYRNTLYCTCTHRIPQLYVQGASTKFRFIYPAHNKKNFAIYTEIDEESKQRAYLLPKIDNEQKGQRQYVIRVMETKNQDPKGKYLFSTSKSTFPGL